MDIHINYLAVLLAAVAHFFLGWAWYSALFAKPWLKEMGLEKMSKKEKEAGMKEMPKAMVINFVTLLVTAYVLAHVIQFAGHFFNVTDVANGLKSAFWIWLGFYATTGVNAVLWEKRSWKLYSINAGYHLVGLLLMGAILAAWT